eukprot:366070-Chlamydomonas_euryale.AAC.11
MHELQCHNNFVCTSTRHAHVTGIHVTTMPPWVRFDANVFILVRMHVHALATTHMQTHMHTRVHACVRAPQDVCCGRVSRCDCTDMHSAA